MKNVVVGGDDLVKFTKEFKAALDVGLARSLTRIQGQLKEANPVKDGIMRSSWNIGHNSPNETIGNGGDPPMYDGKITFDGDWYLTNSVPYAQPVALLGGYPPSWGGQAPRSIPQGWYTSIINQVPKVLGEEFRKAAPK